MKTDDVMTYKAKRLCLCTDKEVLKAADHLVTKIERMRKDAVSGASMAKLFGDDDIARDAMAEFEKQKADCEAMAVQIKAELERRNLGKKGV